MNEDLQFDRAETPGQETTACRQCQAPLRDHYFAVNGAMLCDQCVEAVRQAVAGTGTSAGRFARASMFGAGAAVLAAVAYYLWMGFTKSEFALITIAMGWFVGKAVRRGSGDRGGWRYGLLAVLLTYSAIAFSFFGVGVAEMNESPAAAEVAAETSTSDPKTSAEGAELGERIHPALSVVILLGIAFAMPVLIATKSILSALITGFGLWQAWSINRALNLQITGPHLMGETPSAGA